VADNPGKKAELDKDGLSYEIGKAELDKEGMKLSDEKKPQAQAQAQGAAADTPQEAEAQEKPSRKKIIIIASIAAGVIVLLTAGILTYVFTREKPVEKPVVAMAKPTPPPPGLDTPTGEITLDPFMVLYTPASPKESGVLLAQLSLQVSPEIAYSLGGRMFELRNLIYHRLAANAEVYSKNELIAMLREDLKNFDVRDVGFVQFEKK
jgi:flagellar basal body-associated protein FliL